MRYEIHARKGGVVKNIFKNERSFMTEAGARRTRSRLQGQLDVDEIIIKRVFTDSERLNWLMRTTQFAVKIDGKLTTLSILKDPRAALDAEMALKP